MAQRSVTRLVVAIALLLVVTLLALHSIFGKNNNPAEYYYNIILQEGSIDRTYENQADYVLKKFTRSTRYQNATRLNLPPKSGKLTLILFRFSDDLPADFQRNCVSFPTYETTFCDVNLLDSLPGNLPFVLEAHDDPGPGLLISWVIGHEIGHVVLKHDTRSLLVPSGEKVATRSKTDSIFESVKNLFKDHVSDRTPPTDLKSLRKYVFDGSKNENEADDFFASRYSLNTTSGLMSIMAISDAIFYLDGIYSRNRGNGDKTVLQISKNRHPPLILRLMNISHRLESSYTDYQEPFFVGNGKTYSVEISSQSSTDPEPELYKDLHYHSRPAPLLKPDMVDQALYIYFADGPEAFQRYRSLVCKTAPAGHSKDPVFNELCSRGSPRPAKLPTCDTSSELLACLRTKILRYRACLLADGQYVAGECEDSDLQNSLRAELERVRGSELPNSWLIWTAYAHSEFELRSIAKGAPNLPLEQYIVEFTERWGPEHGLWLINRTIEELRPRDESVPDWLINVEAIGREVAWGGAQYDVAIMYGERVVKHWSDRQNSKLEAGLAFHKTKLGRLYLEAANLQFPHIEISDLSAHAVPKAVAQFKDAIDLRKHILFLAQGTSESPNSKNDESKRRLIAESTEQLSIAVNDAIYALNHGYCESSVTFLPIAMELSSSGSLSEDARATTLENIAGANSCALTGDGAAALKAAEDALSIRFRLYKSGEDSPSQFLSSLFTLWGASEKAGDDETCTRAADLLEIFFRKINHQHVPPNMGTMVSGKFTSIERCLKFAMSERQNENHD